MNDEDINRMLQTWTVEAELPPSFQRDVWRRIATSEAARPSLSAWLEPFLSWIARPLPAALACGLALSTGLIAAGMVSPAPQPSSAVVAYAESINPLAHSAR